MYGMGQISRCLMCALGLICSELTDYCWRQSWITSQVEYDLYRPKSHNIGAIIQSKTSQMRSKNDP